MEDAESNKPLQEARKVKTLAYIGLLIVFGIFAYTLISQNSSERESSITGLAAIKDDSGKVPDVTASDGIPVALIFTLGIILLIIIVMIEKRIEKKSRI